MRRRRTTRWPTPNTHRSTTASREGEQVASSSSIAKGWVWNPIYLLAALWTVLGALAGQAFWDLTRIGNEMALGLARWLAGGGAEAVPMTEQGEGKKVKRRRRKETPAGEVQHFPGMVNLSGTLCYMNSVLQAFASIPSLISHLERIVALAMDVDIPTPVTDALLDILQELNTPKSRPPPALRPHALLHSLQTLPAFHRLLGTREQQDAHELFVVLAEAVSDEAVKVAAEVAQVKGLGEVLSLQGYTSEKGKGTAYAREESRDQRRKVRGLAQPWEGLMARRRVCRKCSWCEAVRMDTLGGMELPVPLHGDTTLDACIAQYLAPEHLTDVTCEMCSLRQTLAHYRSEAMRLATPPSGAAMNDNATRRTASGSFAALEDLNDGPVGHTITASRKKRAKEIRRVEARLQEMLVSQTIMGFGESTIQPGPSSSVPIPIKWQTARTDSLREAIVTRPPQSLRLHFVRSEYTNYGTLLKKTARVTFPVFLDLTRFVARGVWEERAGVLGAIAANGAAPPRRAIYRLESAIMHYGYTHSSGHYVCIRRKPRRRKDDEPDEEVFRPTTTRKSCPDGCHCQSCAYFGQVRDVEGEESVPGRGWLRISDADVEEVGEEALIEARGAVFMLFYERVGEYEGESRPALPQGMLGNGEADGPVEDNLVSAKL